MQSVDNTSVYISQSYCNYIHSFLDLPIICFWKIYLEIKTWNLENNNIIITSHGLCAFIVHCCTLGSSYVSLSFSVLQYVPLHSMEQTPPLLDENISFRLKPEAFLNIHRNTLNTSLNTKLQQLLIFTTITNGCVWLSYEYSY